MMNSDQLEGAAKNVAGKVQSAVGGVVDDASSKLTGEVRQVGRKLQERFENACASLSSLTRANPIGVLAAVAVGGFLLASLFGSRRT